MKNISGSSSVHASRLKATVFFLRLKETDILFLDELHGLTKIVVTKNDQRKW